MGPAGPGFPPSPGGDGYGGLPPRPPPPKLKFPSLVPCKGGESLVSKVFGPPNRGRGELSRGSRRPFSSQFPSGQAIGLETAGTRVSAVGLKSAGVLESTRRLKPVAIDAGCGTGDTAQLLLELLGPLAIFRGDFLGDDSLLDQLQQVLVHGLHPLPEGHLHRAVKLVPLAFPNQVLHGVVAQHHLQSRNPTVVVDVGQELLVDNSLQNGCQLRTNLGVLVGREKVYPTFPIWLKSFLSNSSMVFQPLSNYGLFLRVPSYNNSMICHFAVRCRRHHGGT